MDSSNIIRRIDNSLKLWISLQRTIMFGITRHYNNHNPLLLCQFHNDSNHSYLNLTPLITDT